MSQSRRSPRPCRAGVSGPQTENHQVPGVSSPILIMARRNSSASVRDSSTRAVPPGRSIMAAATSQDAMIAYCGLVEVYMRKASLKTCSSRSVRSESCTRICEACDRPASSLWVDWVATTSDVAHRGRLGPMACIW
jgi:hypothetical protein